VPLIVQGASSANVTEAGTIGRISMAPAMSNVEVFFKV